MMRFHRWCGVLLLTLALAGCASGHGNATLYQRLGGLEGISGIVDAFLYELAADEQILPLFADTNIERFREKFIEQLCMVADGPCEYTGDDMVATHRGMEITHAQFNRVVTDLIRAMERRDIPTGAQNDLLRRLAAMYDDIVAV